MRPAAAARYIGPLAVLLAAIACGSAETPIEPAQVFEQKTEIYTGSIVSGGSTAFHFPVQNPGDIRVSITQLSPVSTLTMGIWLGAWDPATETCPNQLATNSATLNVIFTGSPSGPAEYCVAIYDVGNLQSAAEFTLTVTHY